MQANPVTNLALSLIVEAHSDHLLTSVFALHLVVRSGNQFSSIIKNSSALSFDIVIQGLFIFIVNLLSESLDVYQSKKLYLKHVKSKYYRTSSLAVDR